MTNPKLARDYLSRGRKRLKAVAVLLAEEAFADVVRESQEIVENYAEIVKKARGAMTTDEFAATLNEKATVIQKIETGKLHLTLKLAKKIEKQYRVKLINQRDTAEDIEDVIWKPEKKVDFTPSLGDFVKQKKE